MSLSSRGLEILTDSYATRVDILLDVISSSNILPQSFGLGTATSYLVANAFDLDLNSVATESLYATLYANLGFMFASIFILIMMAALIISYYNRNFLLFSVLLVITCCSAF